MRGAPVKLPSCLGYVPDTSFSTFDLHRCQHIRADRRLSNPTSSTKVKEAILHGEVSATFSVYLRESRRMGRGGWGEVAATNANADVLLHWHPAHRGKAMSGIGSNIV